MLHGKVVEQALANAQLALEVYSNQHNALGTANANRLLGEINTRRGQLSYASATMERALRTYKAISYRLGQAETILGLGDIQRLRGFLSTAVQSYEDARKLASRTQNDRVEG